MTAAARWQSDPRAALGDSEASSLLSNQPVQGPELFPPSDQSARLNSLMNSGCSRKLAKSGSCGAQLAK